MSSSKKFFIGLAIFAAFLLPLAGACWFSYHKGYEKGYDEGKKKGYDEGYDEGKRVGYNLGYDEGYHEGYRIGCNNCRGGW